MWRCPAVRYPFTGGSSVSLRRCGRMTGEGGGPEIDQKLMQTLLDAFEKSDWQEMTVTIGSDRLHVSRRPESDGTIASPPAAGPAPPASSEPAAPPPPAPPPAAEPVQAHEAEAPVH